MIDWSNYGAWLSWPSWTSEQAPYYAPFDLLSQIDKGIPNKTRGSLSTITYLLIIGGLLGIYCYILEYVPAYLCIRVYSSRLIRRCSGVKSLIITICASPTMQYGVNDHSFCDICRPLWCRGIKDCLPLWRHVIKFEVAGAAIMA